MIIDTGRLQEVHVLHQVLQTIGHATLAVLMLCFLAVEADYLLLQSICESVIKSTEQESDWQKI